jgi:hypothetical protein
MNYWRLINRLAIVINNMPIPVAARSKSCVCGCLLAGILGSNPGQGMDVCLLLVLYVVS